MKLEKFMCEVTKALLKGERVGQWEYNGDILISTNGYVGMIVPKHKYIFNGEVSSRCTFIPLEWQEHPLRLTNLQEVKGRTVYRLLKSKEEDFEVLIDEKYMGYFDKDPQFYSISPTSPVIVTEDNMPCGIIMPIKRGDK